MPAADALCRASLARSTRPASTAASSKDDDLARPERLASTPAPLRLLSQGREGGRLPTPAISTIHEHEPDPPSPVPPARGFPRRELLRVAAPLSRPRPTGLSWIRGASRGQSLHAPPGAIARTEVGYPDPCDPDTFCRRYVTRTAGGAALAGCTIAHPLRTHRRARFRTPAAVQSCFRRTFRQDRFP